MRKIRRRRNLVLVMAIMIEEIAKEKNKGEEGNFRPKGKAGRPVFKINKIGAGCEVDGTKGVGSFLNGNFFLAIEVGFPAWAIDFGEDDLVYGFGDLNLNEVGGVSGEGEVGAA